MNEKISVIVPIYNIEKYLDRCIESIVGQTYENLEIILVDDGSKDSCPQICDDWASKDDRIKVIHKENGGVSSCRNVGMQTASGDYIGFVDGDDFIHKQMYEKLLTSIKENHSDVSMCGYVAVNENTQKCVKKQTQFLKSYESSPIDLDLNCNNLGFEQFYILDNILGAVWRYLFKKDIIQTISFNEDLFIAEDFIFLFDVFLRKMKISVVAEGLYFYVQRASSAIHSMSKKRLDNRILSSQVILEKLKEVFDKDIVDAKKFGIFHIIVQELLRTGQKKEAKQLMNTDFMTSLYSKRNYKLAMKHTLRMRYKVAYFLTYHHLLGLYQLLLKFKGS